MTVVLGGRDVRVPVAQTRGQRFDDLVLDAVEDLEQRWATELEGVEFAVEDVPAVPLGIDPALDDDVVTDDTAGGAVPLGRLLPAGTDGSEQDGRAGGRLPPAAGGPCRRPQRPRHLVRDVVVDQVARLLTSTPTRSTRPGSPRRRPGPAQPLACRRPPAAPR